MQRMTIIREDNAVAIDGRFYTVDCSSVPADVHIVQWYGAVGEGEIEFVQPYGKPKPSAKRIKSITAYQTVIDLWNEAHATQLAAEAAEEAIAAARRETMATSGMDVNLSKV